MIYYIHIQHTSQAFPYYWEFRLTYYFTNNIEINTFICTSMCTSRFLFDKFLVLEYRH